MLTDLDTESYYVIEGVLVDKNKQTEDIKADAGAGGPGAGYYKLPHAIGAAKVFLSFVVVIIKSGFSSKINFTFSIFCFFNLTCFVFTNFEICVFTESLITMISHFSFNIDFILFSASFPPPTTMIFLPSRFRLIIIDPRHSSFYLCIKNHCVKY